MNLLIACALASVAAAPIPKADPVEEIKKSFQGEWKMIEYTKIGSSDTKEQLADAKVTVTGDKMEVTRRGKKEEATFTLDPKADPSAIDIKVTRPGQDAMIVKGIYKLEKDKLTICFGLDDKDRPKEFKSAEDLSTGMFVLERAKK